MALILLSENPASVEVATRGTTLIVHHREYQPPMIPGALVMDFAEFKPCCRQLIRGVDSLVFVGLNKAMTPGNRTEDVWELLFNQTKWLQKISLDTTIFVSEPWRAWFHFGFVGSAYRDYTYSFIAESNHKAFLDGVRPDDPFALEEMLRWGSGLISSDYSRWFNLTVSFATIAPAVHAEYAEQKRMAFDEEATASKIVERLTLLAAAACPSRYVPTPQQLFRCRRHEIVATDLAVDHWLVNRLRHLAELVNGVAKEFRS